MKTGEFDFPSPEWDDISDAAKEFVTGLLQKDPADRYAGLFFWVWFRARPLLCIAFFILSRFYLPASPVSRRFSAEEALKHHWFKEQLDEDTIRVKSNHVISAHSRRMVANFSEYLAKKRLKKVALNFIANDLTEAEAEPLLEIFQKITKSEKDIITVEELDDAIDQGDFSSTIKNELTTLRDNLDRSGITRVNWKEFVVQFMDKNIAKREENIQKVLRRFSNKGPKTHLCLEDVAEIFGGENAAKEIFEYLDKEGKGLISLNDFQKAVEQSLDDPDEEEEADFESDDEFHDG